MRFDHLRLTEGQWKSLLETARRTTESLGARSREIADHVQAHVEVLIFTGVYHGVPDEERVAAPRWIREELESLTGEGA
jgi:hypothetical protein